MTVQLQKATQYHY